MADREVAHTAAVGRGAAARVGRQPADRPYGVEAVMRDNSGNWLVLVEPKPYTAGDFGP